MRTIHEREELLVREVAALVGCTHGAVNAAIRAGRLPARIEGTPYGPVYWVPRTEVPPFKQGYQAWKRNRHR